HAKAEVGPDPPKRRIPVGDQTHAHVVVREGRLRRAENRSDDVVVEVRGPQGELGLLQREEAVVVPGTLPKDRKGKRVPPKEPRVRSPCLANVGENLRTEQPGEGSHRPERPDPSEY